MIDYGIYLGLPAGRYFPNGTALYDRTVDVISYGASMYTYARDLPEQM